MIEELIIPSGKLVAAAGYCQLYVLNSLKKHKAARAIIEEDNKWPEVIKQGLDMIAELINIVGNYDKVRSGFRDMDRYFTNEATNPFNHPNFNRVRMYSDLTEFLSHWLGSVYRGSIGDYIGAFRDFIRTPVVPINQSDKDIFGQSLQQLNQYLAANNSLALGYNKLY